VPGVEVCLKERPKSGETSAARLQGSVSFVNSLTIVFYLPAKLNIILNMFLIPANRFQDVIGENQLPVTATGARTSNQYKSSIKIMMSLMCLLFC
jgi:hypothetical protein